MLYGIPSFFKAVSAVFKESEAHLTSTATINMSPLSEISIFTETSHPETPLSFKY